MSSSSFPSFRLYSQFLLFKIYFLYVVLKGSKYKIEFVCTGMVTDIKLEKSWCYVSCPRCTKKLQRTVSSLRDLQ
ncbi:hypothetical protein Bca101_085386 [Brassica carinata]